MSKIKISAVSYTNTKPFIYGLEHSEIINKIDLSLDIPADCAEKLKNNQVDIGLIPVAEIPNVPNANIVADYCIGSVGAVNSVFIFSSKEVAEIKTVKLDNQSRTSNNLAKVLLRFHWKKEVVFTTDPEASTDAIVLIGDRTFGKAGEFAFAYDMGREWLNFTGLPFVYAAWVANKTIPQSFIDEFNKALAFGLSQRTTVLADLPAHKDFDLQDYFFHKLDFELTSEKRKALELFLAYISKL